MATRDVTLNQLLDDAVETLPLVRRKVMQARMRNPRARAKVLDELQLDLYDDPRAATMGIRPVFGSASFTADTPFQIDISNLEQILRLIVEYLPQIISLITALFGSVMLFIAIGLGGSTAYSADLNPLSLAEIQFATATAQDAAWVTLGESQPIHLPETEGRPPVCSCKTGSECDCDDCDCKDCPCSTVKQDLIVDPVTGVEVSGPAIIQLTIHGCEPCIRWVQQEANKYRKAGWKVPYPVSGIKAPAYPSFRIYDGKRWHQHTGWLTGDDMRRILGGGTANSSNPRVSVGAAVVRFPAAAAGSSGRDWLIGGQPWTRQGLVDHLATHSNHGHSRAQLQGMSFEQLNALHNSDYESQRAPMRSTVMSSCPGGSCPPQSYSGRGGGIFGLGVLGR